MTTNSTSVQTTEQNPWFASQPAADAAYEQMMRWELADTRYLNTGDRVSLSETALNALIAIDPGTINWAQMEEHAPAVAWVGRYRVNGVALRLEGQQGLISGVDLVLRLKATP